MTFWIIFCILTDWYEKLDVCFMLPLIFKMLERCSKCKMFKMQNSSEINLSFSRKLFFMFHCFFRKAFQKFYIVFFRFVKLFYTKISLLSVYAFISLFFLNLVRNCKLLCYSLYPWMKMLALRIENQSLYPPPYPQPTLHTKWSFLLRISSASVTKSAVSCGFGHIY